MKESIYNITGDEHNKGQCNHSRSNCIQSLIRLYRVFHTMLCFSLIWDCSQLNDFGVNVWRPASWTQVHFLTIFKAPCVHFDRFTAHSASTHKTPRTFSLAAHRLSVRQRGYHTKSFMSTTILYQKSSEKAKEKQIQYFCSHNSVSVFR